MACILVVDDERPVRDVIEIFLSKKGYEVRTCADGTTALELLRGEDAIDLMILDNRMPGMKGAEVLDHMEEEGIGTPVILLTGSVSATEIDPKGRNVLRKPIDLNELLSSVENALAG